MSVMARLAVGLLHRSNTPSPPIALGIIILALGPVGMTVLGWLAVGQIRGVAGGRAGAAFGQAVFARGVDGLPCGGCQLGEGGVGDALEVVFERHVSVCRHYSPTTPTGRSI